MNKHVCKVCNRSYPCGRSLGGHMRSHVYDAPPDADEPAHSSVKLASLCDYSDDDEAEEEEDQVDEDEDDHTKIEMRHNSIKKKSKAMDSGNRKKFNCVKCGKGFLSQKAMCGHMACHSEKDKNLSNLANHSKNSSSWFNQKHVMDSHSDTETSAPAASGPSSWRRSKRTKYKNNNAGSKLNFSEPDLNGGNFTGSGIESEQEEMAKCLMMLSRDSSKWGGPNSIRDSSELSVKMEDVSRFNDGLIGVRLKPRPSAACTELAKELRNKPMNDSWSPEMWSGSMNKNVSLRNGFECLVPNLPLAKHAGKQHNRRNKRSSSFSDTDNEISLETSMSPLRPDPRKGKGKIGRSGSKLVKHECPVCLKEFRSGQALGGHKRIHLSGVANGMKPVNLHPLLQDSSSSQAHSHIDLNRPALGEDQEFMPW